MDKRKARKNREPRKVEKIVLGPGGWYACVQTADGDLHILDTPATTSEWALRRAGRRAEQILSAARNLRDCRGGRDQTIGARIGPAHWYGTLGVRTARIVRLLVVRAPSLQAVVSTLAGHLYGGSAMGSLLSYGVRRVVIASLKAVIEAAKERRRALVEKARELRLAINIAVELARRLAPVWRPAGEDNSQVRVYRVNRKVDRQIRALLRSGRPGALALAGRLAATELLLPY